MGNTASTAQVPQQRSGVQDLASKQASKSWATTDHTLSGPWSFVVKEHVQCICEGGRNCTKENPARQRTPNAIPGLHSNWVGDKILAMARPWQENVMKHDLVSRFKEANIGMVLNLQEVGEHDSCGPGNLPSTGFTYSFEPFTNAGITYCNMSWRDMGVPTLDKMMDIVQVMHHVTAVEQKKTAVHCHAGLGRTGLAIACFLVFHGEASALQAVELVRKDRPGAVQTKAQLIFVSIFEQYLQHLRCLFKVADLRQLSLGNENYILTKVSRKISRSLSAHNSNTTDPMAAATAALNIISVTTPATTGGSPTKAPAALTDGAAADWSTASFEPTMTAEEAAKVPSAAEVAANAALNIGSSGATDGVLVQHARRLSGGGGSMKLTCNLKAIKEDIEKPVHVIETDSAVTEVYGHGLTIIRSAQSVKKLQASAPLRRPTVEQLVMDRLPTTKELGLDNHTPWNEKFHVKPEAYVAEGWLPEAPSSYLEALRRQQRLLHGVERRLSLRLHKVLKAAAKALTKSGQDYNEVSEHSDPSLAASGSSPSSPLKKCHSRSRSSAAADLLALTSNLGTISSGGGLNSSSSGGGSNSASPARNSYHQSSASGFNSSGGGWGSLLPSGIHFGAPGTSVNSGSRAVSRCSSNSCLAGCCAPNYAAGLLAALLYKGRFPDEFKPQWSLCPRLQSLGFAEGPMICSQLHTVKLALNGGDYQPLEAATGAVALVVLGDWFESFTTEALTENTLELLIDDADSLLQETRAALEARKAALERMSDAPASSSQPRPSSSNGGSSVSGSGAAQDSDENILARRASARAVCCALSAPEQDLFLLLAAVLRHVRLASIDDSRLQAAANSSKPKSSSGAAAAGDGGQTAQLAGMSQQQQVVDAEVDAAMAALYKIMASWLLGPLAVACAAALEAVQAFLNYLTLDDIAYAQLLHATREQGIRKLHSQPAIYSQPSNASSTDSLEGLLNNNITPATPRSQLKSRLMNSLGGSGGGSSPSGGGTGSNSGSGTAPGLGKSKLGHTASSPQLLKKGGQSSDKLGPDGEKELGQFLNSADGVTSVVATSKGKPVQIQMAMVPPEQQQQQQQSQQRAVAAGRPTGNSLDAGQRDRSSSTSQLIQEGSTQLCIARQQGRSGSPVPSNLSDELAGLAGKQQQQQDAGELTGSLASPPRSVSPVPPNGNKGSSNPGARHYHLPAIRQSGNGAATAAAAGSQGNTAGANGSPASSSQFMPGQLAGQAAGDPASAAPSAASAAAARAPSGAISAVPSAMMSSIDVGASQLLSVSMLSDIGLPSFASNLSVAESMMAQGRQSVENVSGLTSQGNNKQGTATH